MSEREQATNAMVARLNEITGHHSYYGPMALAELLFDAIDGAGLEVVQKPKTVREDFTEPLGPRWVEADDVPDMLEHFGSETKTPISFPINAEDVPPRRRPKASDISDRAVLSAIRVIQRERDAGRWQGATGGRASIWDIQGYLNAWPRKVVRAKLRSMIKRGLIEGCVHYGTDCRGDFKIAEEKHD